MEIKRIVNISHLDWQGIEHCPRHVTMTFKTGDKLIISQKQIRDLYSIFEKKKKCEDKSE